MIATIILMLAIFFSIGTAFGTFYEWIPRIDSRTLEVITVVLTCLLWGLFYHVS